MTFFKNFLIAWNVQKSLFDSRPTVSWPPTTVTWPFSDFFQKIFKLLETCKNVVWQSADGRVTYDHCRVTIQWLFSTIFLIAWNVQKTLFDSRPTVAWPPTTVTWPFSDFFKIPPNCLKRSKNVVWQSADGRVTSDHCCVTVQWLFSKISQIAWNVQKFCLTVGRRSRGNPTTVAWPYSDFFLMLPNCLERRKNVVWQSAEGRMTSKYCRVTVEQLFSKFFLIAWNVGETLFESQQTVA